MITVEDVRAAMGGQVGTDPESPDGVHLAVVVKATNAYVSALPDVSGPWTDAVALGARLLATRLYSRRNSPAGVAAFSDMGTAYVSRYDPDIERLLNIGKYAPPVVA